MLTYDNAYQNVNYNSAPVTHHKSKQFTVISAKRINVYHYHGSWFDYTWEMIVKNEKQETKTEKLDTYNDYKMSDLIGEKIKYDGDTFQVIN